MSRGRQARDHEGRRVSGGRGLDGGKGANVAGWHPPGRLPLTGAFAGWASQEKGPRTDYPPPESGTSDCSLLARIVRTRLRAGDRALPKAGPWQEPCAVAARGLMSARHTAACARTPVHGCAAPAAAGHLLPSGAAEPFLPLPRGAQSSRGRDTTVRGDPQLCSTASRRIDKVG
jgi:hypothetical protein